MENLEEIINLILQETIKKRKNKYCLISGKGRNLGCYRNRSGAKKREKQVQYFKHVKKKKMKETSVAANIAGFTSPLGIKKRKEDE